MRPNHARIGLFIGVRPDMGGVYQYTLGLLDAFLALPDCYAKTVVYTHPSWADRLGTVEAVALDERVARRSLALGTLLTVAGIPMTWWHRVAPTLDPVARTVVAQACDVWLVSAHSFVCTQLPGRVVGTVQDLMHRYERQFTHDTPLATYLWRERVFSNVRRYAYGVLVDSELGRDQFVASYGATPERVFPLPFIAPRTTSLPSPAGFDDRYALPGKYLLYPAQFWEHKNHARLLRALAALRADGEDVHLVLAGGKRLGFARCQAQVQADGLEACVTFLGYVPDEDLSELYRRARGLIYPTFYGPTNIPPLEAFVLGCPVAASGIYGMPEQLGDAALLFDPRSEPEIAEAMRTLWTDDARCRDLVERGRKRAAAWGQPDFNARLTEIVAELCARLPPRP